MKTSSNPIPEHLRPRIKEQGQLFNSGILEKLTRTHIAVPIGMHTILAIAIFSYGFYSSTGVSLMQGILFFLAGWLIWTLTEYWVHRKFYHLATNSAIVKKLQHLGHGIHHQHPKDADRLAMPPLPAIVLISLFFGLFWLIFQQAAFFFFPGFQIGYTLYIGLHYAQHRYKAPKFTPLKKLWKFHTLHHYKYPETKAFGVSTRLWDWVFGTMP